MMITNTEMTNWIIEKFSGSGGIRTHDRIPPEPLNFSIIQLVISVLVIIIDIDRQFSLYVKNLIGLGVFLL